MAMQTGNFAELLDPGLREIYGLQFDSHAEEYSKVFDIQTSKRNYEESLSLTGFGQTQEKTEGGSVQYGQAYQGYKQTVTHVTYGLGFQITREMYEDDLYAQMKALPKALAKSVSDSIETDAFNVFNRAFDATYTGPDGVELCSTGHPLLGGSTLANELDPAADLSMTSYEQVMIDIAGWTDDRGLKLKAMPQMLLVAPQNAWTAKQILGSEKDPESANNAINPAMNSLPKGMMVGHYLTDSDAWFVLTDVSPGLIFYYRRRPEFTRDNDFDTENGKWKTTYRTSRFWCDHKNVFGSPGV